MAAPRLAADQSRPPDRGPGQAGLRGADADRPPPRRDRRRRTAGFRAPTSPRPWPSRTGSSTSTSPRPSPTSRPRSSSRRISPSATRPSRCGSSNDDLLLVAVADPTDVGRADDLRLALGHNVRLAVSDPGDLERTIKKLYRTQIEVVEEVTGAEVEELFDADRPARGHRSSRGRHARGQARPRHARAGDRGRRLRHPLRAAGGRDDRPRADRRRHASGGARSRRRCSSA